jgi:hypothetical protein
MDESGYSQISLNLYHATRRQSPDSNFRSNRREQVKSRGLTVDLYDATFGMGTHPGVVSWIKSYYLKLMS